MMRNFQLLESEHDHSGSDRQGPLAAFDETFKGRDYYHIRRVYRGVGGSWSPTGNGISCTLDQREAMLGAVAQYLATGCPDILAQYVAGPVKAKRNGKVKPARDEANPPHEAENLADAAWREINQS